VVASQGAPTTRFRDEREISGKASADLRNVGFKMRSKQ
jgi:hypothetical protein